MTKNRLKEEIWRLVDEAVYDAEISCGYPSEKIRTEVVNDTVKEIMAKIEKARLAGFNECHKELVKRIEGMEKFIYYKKFQSDQKKMIAIDYHEVIALLNGEGKEI